MSEWTMGRGNNVLYACLVDCEVLRLNLEQVEVVVCDARECGNEHSDERSHCHQQRERNATKSADVTHLGDLQVGFWVRSVDYTVEGLGVGRFVIFPPSNE